MRLDYTLYVLAALLFLITIISLVTPLIAETERNLWVVTTAVLGILSVGLGYSQRPKTEAQACQRTKQIPQTTMPQKPTTAMKTPAMTKALELTHVKGIGEKRAAQLKTIGINSVEDLAKTSATTIAKKMQISPKTTKKWTASAKKLVR